VIIRGHGLSDEQIVRNSRGHPYPYFHCLGPPKRRTNCEFRAVPIRILEEAVERHWRAVTITEAQRDGIRAAVLEHIGKLLKERDRHVRAAERRVRQLADDRALLIRAHYSGAAVLLDQLREKQERIAGAAGANAKFRHGY
jgi:site-specific DNA recombinase